MSGIKTPEQIDTAFTRYFNSPQEGETRKVMKMAKMAKKGVKKGGSKKGGKKGC